jgi:hypothetical protein
MSGLSHVTSTVDDAPKQVLPSGMLPSDTVTVSGTTMPLPVAQV